MRTPAVGSAPRQYWSGCGRENPATCWGRSVFSYNQGLICKGANCPHTFQRLQGKVKPLSKGAENWQRLCGGRATNRESQGQERSNAFMDP